MDDHELETLLHEAVSDVEPTDRLAEIRRATEAKPRRFGWYAVGGTALAVAATVTAFALVSPTTPDRRDPSEPPTPPSSAIDTPTPTAHAVAVYYVGDTPAGPRLYREFHIHTGMGDVAEGIGDLMAGADDPDYRTGWPAGSLGSADYAYDGGTRVTRVEIELADPSLHDRPTGMSAAEADLAIQQVIFTVQASMGRRLPVQFTYDGNPIDQVLGVPTSEPLANAKPLDVLSLMSISDPVEGLVVTDSFQARGAASSFEGTVDWQIRDNVSGADVLAGFATAGMDPDHLVEWETSPIDVSELDPGTYTFYASTSDPSDGEGIGVFTDTRTIVIE